MPEAVYNTAECFKNDYEDEWILDPRVREMVCDVDRSIVLPCGVIDSPVLGKIPPLYLSGGVKTLILTLFKPDKIFNASTCGDNCAKWFLKIAEKEDRTINLRHIMDFGEGSFEILVLNSDIIVHSQKELVEEALISCSYDVKAGLKQKSGLQEGRINRESYSRTKKARSTNL